MMHWLKGRKWAAALAVASVAGLTMDAQAGIVSFQSESAFNAALTGKNFNRTDFESVAANTSFADHTGPVGAGFDLLLGGTDAGSALPTVGNQFWTTSGTNYLGLNNADSAFETGDTLTFTFSVPVRGFGIYLIGGTDLQAGDVVLTTNGASVSNSASAASSDGQGSFAYFVGLASDDAVLINSVTLSVLDAQSQRLLAIDFDDATVVSDSQGGPTVPEPGVLALFALGLLGMRRKLRP